MLRVKIFVFVLMLLISGTAFAAPEGTEPPGEIPTILFFPVVDNTGLKDSHDYMSAAINAQYAKKYPTEKFTVIPFQDGMNQVSINDEPKTEDEVIKAATAAGADYAIRTELQKVKIRRGVKGIFLKKWCAAEVPVKITIWDAASGQNVFDSVIQTRGDREAFIGGTIGLLLSVSKKATIQNSIEKVGKKMAQELPALQQNFSNSK